MKWTEGEIKQKWNENSLKLSLPVWIMLFSYDCYDIAQQILILICYEGITLICYEALTMAETFSTFNFIPFEMADACDF